MLKQKNQDYKLAFTQIHNNQNISAYNQFKDLASDNKKNDPVKSALYYLLAAESKKRQGKESSDEMMEAGNLFLSYAKNEKNYLIKTAFLCASKCFLRGGDYKEAKKSFEKARQVIVQEVEDDRPIVIVDDSESIVIRLENFLKQLGYDNTISFDNGKDAIKGCKQLISDSKNPIFLLDMGLPDVGGDEVATKILNEKNNSQIILITADEKTSQRANKAISSGVTAFIQKPFTITDLKEAIDAAESEYSAL